MDRSKIDVETLDGIRVVTTKMLQELESFRLKADGENEQLEKLLENKKEIENDILLQNKKINEINEQKKQEKQRDFMSITEKENLELKIQTKEARQKILESSIKDSEEQLATFEGKRNDVETKTTNDLEEWEQKTNVEDAKELLIADQKSLLEEKAKVEDQLSFFTEGNGSSPDKSHFILTIPKKHFPLVNGQNDCLGSVSEIIHKSK